MESRVSNAIMERKILYPGKTSTLIKDCSPDTKASSTKTSICETLSFQASKEPTEIIISNFEFQTLKKV